MLAVRVNCSGSWARLVRIHVGGINFDAQYQEGSK
jgi:hypothetical protein